MEFHTGIRHRQDIPLSDFALRRAVSAGELTRVCRGWYAVPHADDEAVAARRVGGTLTAQSLLRKWGIWLLRDDRLHVMVPPNWPARPPKHICAHWMKAPTDPLGQLEGALESMARCSPLPDIVVALDSILDKGILRPSTLAALSGRHHRLDLALRLATPGVQAGGETLVRLFLASRNIRFTVQTQIGTARVDLLVGDRFVIEVDGREFHSGDSFERDRIRDRELLRAGYIVMRISYRMLYQDWEETAAAILEVVHRGAHLWPRSSIRTAN